jgi:iron complex transport system permease protein
MKVKYKIILSIVFSFIAIMTGVGLGSIKVPPSHIINIIGNKVFSLPLQADIQGTAALSIIWNLRLPRTLLAFLVGGAVAVSGSVMQINAKIKILFFFISSSGLIIEFLEE